VGAWVGNLRERARFRAVRWALLAGARRNGLHVVHFSVQRDHLHLVGELVDGGDLGRAMKGLQVRLARAVNRALGRKGRVVSDRYHARSLSSPREVRNALVYVLNNRRKHAAKEGTRIGWEVDPCSSARVFDGWAAPVARDDEALERALPPPRTWLLSTGWRRRGLIALDAEPRAARARG
jgi:hypothetical protein